MADRYWVGGTGTWDGSATTHWAASTGGASGASAPTSADNAIFDSASNGSAYTVTIATGAVSLSQTWAAPATGDVTRAGSANMDVYGSLTLYAGLVNTYSGRITTRATSGTQVFTSAGVTHLGNLTLNGSGGTVQLADAITFSGSRVIILTAGTFDPNGFKVTFTSGVNSAVITGAWTFADLEFNSSQQGSLATESITVTGTFTFAGASRYYQSLLKAGSIGTQATITAATVSLANVDVQDISGAGAGSWDFSGQADIGDMGGNTGLTFPAAVTHYWVGDTGATNDDTQWSSSSGGAGGTTRIPLPQDAMIFDSNSFSTTGFTVSQSLLRFGSMDWTLATNSPTLTTATAASFIGSITLISGMTLTASTSTYKYEGRGASTLTSAGKSWAKSFEIDSATGTLTLGDALTLSERIVARSGTFNDGGFTVTATYFATGTGTQAIVMGSGAHDWILTSGTVNPWQASTATVTGGSATIRLTGTLTAARQFQGGDETYYKLSNETAGAFALQLTGSNTFTNGIYVDASAAARTVQFTAGTTTTVGDFTRDGGTNVLTIGSITASAHTLAKSGGGTIELENMVISYSTATPGSTWYAPNSTDGGNNSGWTFSAASLTVYAETAVSNFVALAGTATLVPPVTSSGGRLLLLGVG